FMNHFGLKRVVTVALAVIAAGLIGAMFMRELWQLVLLWGVVLGIGTGVTALVLGATVASRWFDKRRGLVVGLMTASNATGHLTFVPFRGSLSDSIGWRTALGFVVVVLAAAFVLAGLLLRDYPADVGLPVYGQPAVSPPPARTKTFRDLLASPLLAL